VLGAKNLPESPRSELKKPPMHSPSPDRVLAWINCLRVEHVMSLPAFLQLTWRPVGVGTLNSHSTELESALSTVPPPEVK